MAAHLLRSGNEVLLIITLLLPFLLIWKSRVSARVVQLALIIFGIEWIRTLVMYIQIRMSINQDWGRLALILGSVALVNFVTLLVFWTKSMRNRYQMEEYE
jgi:hypothetical protein